LKAFREAFDKEARHTGRSTLLLSAFLSHNKDIIDRELNVSELGK